MKRKRKEIDELFAFFEKAKLPNEKVKLNEWTTIDDPRLFVETHIATLKANSGNKYFLPYYNRLVKFKQLLENEHP